MSSQRKKVAKLCRVLRNHIQRVIGKERSNPTKKEKMRNKKNKK